MGAIEHEDFFFIQMCDPQFGLYARMSGSDEDYIAEMRSLRLIVRPAPKITGMAHETELYEKAIDAANRLSPEFVVVCGDMTQDWNDRSQLAELRRITAKLRPDIPVHWVAGNHDIGNDLNPQSLRIYRDRFGDDNYFFDCFGTRFVVLNSNVGFDPSKAPGEWESQLDFLEMALVGAEDRGSARTVVFTHHPLFLEHPDEADSLLVIPGERRRVLLDMLRAHGSWGMFSGHWHANNYASVGDFQMVTSAAVGYPFGDDPSGLRIVKVFEDRIEHKYYGFDDVPDSVDMG